MLQLEELSLNFFLAQRVVAARCIEIDDVARVRFFKHRLRRAQRLFTNRRELHVAVAAFRKTVFRDHGRRGGGR